MKEHLLLEKAFVYPLPISKPSINGYKYDKINGYWINNESGKPYVNEMGGGPRTKKCDIETGEDQKGE